MKPKVAILILSHVTNPQVENHFAKIKLECSDIYNVVLLSDNTSGTFNHKKNDPDYFIFTLSNLSELEYPGKNPKYSDEIQFNKHYRKDFHFRPGSTDLPLLYYYRNNPNYDYYWIVEYDVRYTGMWNEFFEIFEQNDSDLLGTTLTRYSDIRDWDHWDSLDLLDDQVPEREIMRGFFPVYRISRRALETLDRTYRDGVSGHYECLVPTVLNREGLTLEDIGGDGEFVRPGNVNRCYRNTRTTGGLSPGTFVFRPAMRRQGREPGMLWHPVKYAPLWRVLLRKIRRALLRKFT